MLLTINNKNNNAMVVSAISTSSRQRAKFKDYISATGANTIAMMVLRISHSLCSYRAFIVRLRIVAGSTLHPTRKSSSSLKGQRFLFGQYARIDDDVVITHHSSLPFIEAIEHSIQ